MKHILLISLLLFTRTAFAQDVDDFDFDDVPAPPPVAAVVPRPVKKIPFCKKVVVAEAGYAVCFPRKKGACFCLANPK